MSWGKESFALTRAEGRCTPELAEWVLSVADRTLRHVYGPNYSVRCLQGAECIRAVLQSIGVRSCTVVGALCAATAYKGPPPVFSWSGFWGEDHHVWLQTEFSELVDLTVSQLHLHPVKTRSDALPIPALWWHPIDELPPILKYLPTATITIQLPADEMADLDRAREYAVGLAGAEFNAERAAVPTVKPVIMDIGNLNALDRAGLPWLRACAVFAATSPLSPEWIGAREIELMNANESRRAGS